MEFFALVFCCVCAWPVFVAIGLTIKELLGDGSDNDGGSGIVIG